MARKKKKVVRTPGVGGMLVRSARLRVGWSADDLAHHSGVSSSAIEKLEGGHRERMHRSTARLLAGAFTSAGVPLTEKQLRGE
jgi:transcriptional regulator with XRE-family HTH domain